MTDLYRHLPAIHRLRDGETGEPLRALLEAIGREFAVVADDIDQLLDDLFIETADPALIPHIGDLVGYRPLKQPPGLEALARAEVAQTVALRRRKGTLAAIEATARNATGLPAHAREYFPVLARTQYMNRPLPAAPATASLRDAAALEEAGGAFCRLPSHPDVRRIATGCGRHNIPNIGVFLWPVRALALSFSPAVAADARRYRFSPLGHDIALFNRPAAERELGSRSGPLNVPRPIGRAQLQRDLAAPGPRLYGPAPDGPPLGFTVFLDGAAVPIDQVRCCRLDDDGASWLNLPETGVTVDPELGRLALPEPPASEDPPEVRVSFHHGFPGFVGGGEYARALAPPLPGQPFVRVPDDQPTLAAALAAIAGDGVIELAGSGRHAAPAAITVAAAGAITLRAASGSRPVLDLAAPLEIRGGADSALIIDGLLLAGGPVVVPADANALAELTLRHTTLVPGHALDAAGDPVSPGDPSLVVALPLVRVALDRAIVGPIRLDRNAELAAIDSIVDATGPEEIAFAAPAVGPAGALSLDRVTLVGRVHTVAVGLITDSILIARAPAGADPPAPVHVLRRQEGCIRYSWLPPESRTPRRFRCLPGPDGVPSPYARSLRYGTPAYGFLDGRGGSRILEAASDGGEPGVWAHLGLPRLRANLAIRLAEHVPAGAEAGVFEVIEGTDP